MRQFHAIDLRRCQIICSRTQAVQSSMPSPEARASLIHPDDTSEDGFTESLTETHELTPSKIKPDRCFDSTHKTDTRILAARQLSYNGELWTHRGVSQSCITGSGRSPTRPLETACTFLDSVSLDGTSLPSENSILVNHGPSRHFQMLSQDARQSGGPKPVFEGFLTKQGGWRRNWKRRWCIVDESGTIRYYKPNEFTPRGIIKPCSCESEHTEKLPRKRRVSRQADRESLVELTGATIAVVGAGRRAPVDYPGCIIRGASALQLTNYPTTVVATSGHVGDESTDSCRAFAVKATHRTFFFYADTIDDTDKWCRTIRRCVENQ